MTGKRSHGEGSIQPRGNAWRIRYRVNGERFERTVQGTKSDAAKALREALKSGDDGKHVAPDKISLAAWITNWLALKERSIKARSHERYSEILKLHVVPRLGDRPSQRQFNDATG